MKYFVGRNICLSDLDNTVVFRRSGVRIPTCPTNIVEVPLILERWEHPIVPVYEFPIGVEFAPFVSVFNVGAGHGAWAEPDPVDYARDDHVIPSVSR